MPSLNQALAAALNPRQALLAELHSQQTICYRLFHGSQEGLIVMAITSCAKLSSKFAAR